MQLWAYASLGLPVLGAIATWKLGTPGLLLSLVLVPAGAVIALVTTVRSRRHGFGEFYAHTVTGLLVAALMGLVWVLAMVR
ncbi:MAG: hypothetical protein Q8L48_42540 [Archangium sp.]|nr:hypothetical protein [Archangium sp.]